MPETKFKTFEDIDKIMVVSTKIESETPSEEDLKLKLGRKMTSNVLVKHIKGEKLVPRTWRALLKFRK